MERLTAPEQTLSDELSDTGRELIASIPAMGPLIKVFVDMVLPSAYEHRLSGWRTAVSDAIARIETTRSINLDRLTKDDGFADVLLQASQAAIRNRHIEKRLALANTVANAAATATSDRDLELLFIRFIDELTPGHLSLLRFMASHEAQIAQLVGYQDLFELFGENRVSRHMDVPAPELFRLMCSDLIGRGLVRVSPSLNELPGIKMFSDVVVDGDPDAGDLPMILVTSLGHYFVRYIGQPCGPAA